MYFMTEHGNEVELVKELQPEESTALPLRAVHTPTAGEVTSHDNKMARFDSFFSNASPNSGQKIFHSRPMI